MMETTKNVHDLASGAGLGLLGKFLGRFLSVAGDILAARILGPAVFGSYSIGWTLFRLLEILGPAGLDRGVIRFIPQFKDRDPSALKGVIFHSLKISAILGIILGAFMFILSPWLSISVFKKPDVLFILRFFAFGIPFSTLLPVIAAITRSADTVKYAVVVQDIGQPLIALTLLTLFYFLGSRLTGILIADVLSYGACVAIGYYFVRRLYPEAFVSGVPGGQLSASLMEYSIPVALAGLFGAMLYWVDRLVVGYYLSEIEVGIYQAASQLSLIFAVILSGLSTILAPQYSNLYSRGDHRELQQAYSIGNKWGLYIGLPIVCVAFTSPERFLTVLFGLDYSAGWSVLLLLLAGQTINLAAGASAPLLVMTGGQNIWLWLTLSAFALDIILSVFLTPVYSIQGAAFATSVSVGFLFLSVLFAVRRNLRLWPYDLRYFKGLIAGAAALSGSYLAGKLSMSEGAVLFFQLATAGSIFIVVLLALKLDSEDRIFLEILRGKIAGLLSTGREE